MGGINTDFNKVWRMVLFSRPGSTMDPDPPPPAYWTVTELILCSVGVVGRPQWLCSRVLILFLSSDLFVSQIHSPCKVSLIRKLEFYKYKSNFSKFSKLVWRHAYCGACLLPWPRFYFSQLLPMPPPPIAFTGKGTGAVMLLYLFKAGPKCDCHACGHSV